MIALGVTCSLTDTVNHGDSLTNNDNKHNQKVSVFKHNHLPPRLLNQCLHDIFSYLLNERSIVIVLEYAHFADYHTWTVLVDLVDTPSLALVVLTIDPLEDLAHGLNKSFPSMISKDAFSYTPASVEFKRVIVISKKLLNFKSTVLVKLIDYSIPEVDQLLCTVLDVPQCPDGAANMVHQLSGGNPFWCREMALFMKTTGVAEFMLAMKPVESSLPLNASSSESRQLRRVGRVFKYFNRRPFPLSKFPSSPDGIDISRSCSIDYPSRVTRQKPILSEAIRGNNNSQIPMCNSIHPIATHAVLQGESSMDGRSESEDPQFCLLHRANQSTTSQLELFIVCRYEKLSSEDQNVLRTASIIGNDFSKDVLYGILSPMMRTHMDSSLSSLKRNQWVTDSKTNFNIESPTNMEYSFAHPLLYQTLYDLTPASDRARLHYAVASYIEDACEGGPSYFAQLGHQYSLASDCRPKALEYSVRAAVYCFSKGPLFYNEGLNRLKHATQFGNNSVDYEVIIGIIMDMRDMLAESRQQLSKDERKVVLLRSKEERRTMTTIFSKLWAFFTRIPRLAERGEDRTFNAGHLTLWGTNIFIGLLASAGEILQGLVDSAVKGGRVGEPLNWQLPFLAMRDEQLKKEDIRRNMSILRRRSSNHNGERRRLHLIVRNFSLSAASNEIIGTHPSKERPCLPSSPRQLSK